MFKAAASFNTLGLLDSITHQLYNSNLKSELTCLMVNTGERLLAKILVSSGGRSIHVFFFYIKVLIPHC